MRSLWMVALLVTVTNVVRAQAPSSGASAPGPATLAGVSAFVDVAVVPMDTNRVLLNQTVLIKNGRITALGPSATVRVPAGAVQIDGKGKYLIPGLAEMHGHVVVGARDTVEQERKLLHWLSVGVTTVRNADWLTVDGRLPIIKLDNGQYRKDHPANHLGTPGRTLRIGAQAAAGTLLSPRVYTGVAIDSAEDKTADALVREITALKAAGYDFVKDRRASQTATGTAATRVGLPFVGHYPGDGTWAEVLVSGIRSIEHFREFPIALMGPSDIRPWPWIRAKRRDRTLTFPVMPPDTIRSRIAALREAGIWLSPNLHSLRRSGSNLDSAFIAQLKGTELVKQLYAAGVGLLLSTDKDPQVVPEELEAMVADWGLTPYQALVTGTRNVARYFGTQDSTGTVAVGKRADLVLLSGNPLTDIRAVRQPAGVMLGGRWLARAEIDQRLAGLSRAPSPTTTP